MLISSVLMFILCIGLISFSIVIVKINKDETLWSLVYIINTYLFYAILFSGFTLLSVSVLILCCLKRRNM